MTLQFHLDRTSTQPLYQQIHEHVKEMIVSGRLAPGSQLPTVRGLATDLNVTRLTVQNAYAELQHEGWIEATVGRGTFVSTTAPSQTFATAVGRHLTQDAVIGDILQLNQVTGLRSFASASPDPRLFPAAEFWHALMSQRSETHSFASYTSSQGELYLRHEIAEDLAAYGIGVTANDIIVVAGVTQGLSLTAQTLGQPGDRVLVEQPTYLGLLHTIKTFGLKPIPVPLDEEGPQIDSLERLAVEFRPRFLYTVPTFQNPTGVCMSASRRKAILELAERHGFLIVEDDIYARLAYDQPPPPSLKALDHGANVIYVSSYSKALMPGLRLGYIVAPAPLHARLLSLRRANDLCSPPILQRTLAEFLQNGGLKRHLRRVLPIYRERRDALAGALRHHLPHSVTWSEPAGGFCCWLTLPYSQSMVDLQQAALRAGWAFAPGDVFLAEPDRGLHLRICFGAQAPTAIEQAVQVLAKLIRERLETTAGPEPLPDDWMPLV